MDESTAPPPSTGKKIGTIIKGILLLSYVRFVMLFYFICNDLLQIDFSSIYYAAISVRNGRSVFINPLLFGREFWDGVALYPNSRWLYPPLAAYLFIPFTVIPYYYAKWIWSLASVAFCWISFHIVLRGVGVKLSKTQWMLVTICFFWFFPVWALIERGQIDSLCLLLLCSAHALSMNRKPGRAFLGGMVLALATLLKLHCGFMGALFLFRRNWTAAAGAVCGGCLLLLISLFVLGWQANYDYLTKEIPRIAKMGCWGDEDTILPELAQKVKLYKRSSQKTIDDLHLFPKYVEVDGREYVSAVTGFAVSASIPFLYRAVTINQQLNFGLMSLTLFVCGFGLMLSCELKKHQLSRQLSDREMWLQWMLGLTITLLAAPLTWVMNCVWIFPLAIFIIDALQTRIVSTTGIMLLTAGYFLTGVPDELPLTHSFPPAMLIFLAFKPAVGNALCAAGLFFLYYLPNHAADPGRQTQLEPLAT